MINRFWKYGPMGLLFLLLMACSAERSAQQKIKELEEHVAASLEEQQQNVLVKDSLLGQLLFAYADYSQQFKDDLQTPIYLYKMGSYYYRMQNWKEASKHLEMVIDQFEDSKAYPQALLLAASIYDSPHDRNNERAGQLYEKYLKAFPNGEGRATAEFFFKPAEEKMEARIGEMQKQLRSGPKGQLDRAMAHKLVRQYLHYTRNYPSSEFSPAYCFEGGKLASSIGESYDAVQLWKRIYEQYHDFHLYPQTLLQLALEYEQKMPIFMQQYQRKKEFRSKMHADFELEKLTEVSWTEEARKMYEEFLEKYPEHELRPQVEASLKLLGKDPNEVVQNFRMQVDSLRRLQQ